MIREQTARRRSGVSMSPGTVPQPATATSFARFLWIFATLGLVVVVVVIGFLIGIVRALESIDDGLSTASTSVTGATGDVQPLPNYIESINSALSDIDTALKPIPGHVADIADSLKSIRDSAGGTNTSLQDTSQLLSETSGSLENTATGR
jgi:methyl-accepting chemotaxis protein